MVSTFFSHKKQELIGFLHILRGKLTGNDLERIRGANEALNALEAERNIYLSEKKAAEMRVEPDLGRYQTMNDYVPLDKVQRETNNRDVSGY